MNDWPETNTSLILRIKDPQNALAWNELIAIYRPVIYRLARRKGYCTKMPKILSKVSSCPSPKPSIGGSMVKASRDFETG